MHHHSTLTPKPFHQGNSSNMKIRPMETSPWQRFLSWRVYVHAFPHGNYKKTSAIYRYSLCVRFFVSCRDKNVFYILLCFVVLVYRWRIRELMGSFFYGFYSVMCIYVWYVARYRNFIREWCCVGSSVYLVVNKLKKCFLYW